MTYRTSAGTQSLTWSAPGGSTGRAELTLRRAYAFRTFRALELALYHALGDLPEPEVAHRFN
jgi:hypothetical protein